MRKMFFLMLTLMVLGAASMNAQVTIGSDENPHSAAILDLQSTTLGLKLPNVALDDDLTQFVLPEEGGFTAADAVGMIVYNTNPKNPGLYIWRGVDWRSVSTNTPMRAPDLVIGENTYITYNLGATVGTWMFTNSKEGTAWYDSYPGQATGERGYYYSQTQALTACPAGWSLPTKLQFEAFINHALYENPSVRSALWEVTRGSGFRSTGDQAGAWDQQNWYWGKDGVAMLYSSSSTWLSISTDRSNNFKFSVICIKDVE